MEQIFFVGSYTSGDFGDYRAQGEGIYTCRLRASGEMEILACFKTLNPTYLSVDNARRHLYAVQEVGRAAGPSVVALAVQDDYSLRLVNTQPTSGEGPCHLSLDDQGAFLAVANYGSGSVALFPVNEDGSLAREAHSIQHEGSSVHPERQSAPHAHAAVFGPEAETLYAVDLGLDEVKSYRLNRREARLEPLSVTKTPAGAGPRHLALHPGGDYAFIINELASTLSVFRRSPAGLELVRSVSTLPEGFQQETASAAVRVHPSGAFVYASNRGHDSLTVFAFDAAGAELTAVQHVSTGGQIPRDFALSPTGGLVVANQKTNNLLSYALDERTGKLEPTGCNLSLGTPVCICML